MPREIVTCGQCRCRIAVGRSSSRSRLRNGSGSGTKLPIGCSFWRTRLATAADTPGALSSRRATRCGTLVSIRPQACVFRSMYQGSPRPTTTRSLAGIVDLAHHVLLAFAVEVPGEAAGPRHLVAQRARLRAAPVAAPGLEHPPQRVAVAGRAQPLGLGVGGAEQPPDHLIVQADEAGRVVGHEIGHRQRMLAPVHAAAQPAGTERAHRQRLDRGRIAPQALRRLEGVEDAVRPVAGMPVGQRRGRSG